MRNGLSGGWEWSPLRRARRQRRALRPPGASARRTSGSRSVYFPRTDNAVPWKEGTPCVPEAPNAPAWGRLSSILLPQERDRILLSQSGAWRGPLPVAGTGTFPPLPWQPALVAGGGLPPLPRGVRSMPSGAPRRGVLAALALASRPARPFLGSAKQGAPVLTRVNNPLKG